MSWPSFETPERLWVLLVLPLLIVAYVLALRMRARKGLRFTNTGVLGAVMGKQSRWVRHLAVAMSLCSLAALGLAWAQPLGIDKVPRERATLILVIDTSQSMAAVDVPPDRLSAAKQAATEFLRTVPSQYNVAIVALNGSPAIKLPPSTDRGAAERAIGALKLEDGTAIGDALSAAFKAADQAPVGDDGKAAPAGIILLSDGTNTDGPDPAPLAAQAKEKKLPIYTIAYGTENGFVDLDGKRHTVAPDKAALAEIAQRSGGEALDATSVGQLKGVYAKIGSSIGYEEVRKPVTANYAFGALGFAIIAALGAVMMAARWP